MWVYFLVQYPHVYFCLIPLCKLLPEIDELMCFSLAQPEVDIFPVGIFIGIFLLPFLSEILPELASNCSSS